MSRSCGEEGSSTRLRDEIEILEYKGICSTEGNDERPSSYGIESCCLWCPRLGLCLLPATLPLISIAIVRTTWRIFFLWYPGYFSSCCLCYCWLKQGMRPKGFYPEAFIQIKKTLDVKVWFNNRDTGYWFWVLSWYFSLLNLSSNLSSQRQFMCQEVGS